MTLNQRCFNIVCLLVDSGSKSPCNNKSDAAHRCIFYAYTEMVSSVVFMPWNRCLINPQSAKQKLQQTTFNFSLLSFEENKAWFFMWILCLAEDSLETSSLIFSEKQWKNINVCRLLQSWLALLGLDNTTVQASTRNFYTVLFRENDRCCCDISTYNDLFTCTCEICVATVTKLFKGDM